MLNQADIQKEIERRATLQEEYLGTEKPVNKIEPMVSVYVATYQHAPYIKACLDGIIFQEVTFPIEIIIGEDDSTDGTRAICIEYGKKYPDKIRLFLRDRNLSHLKDERGQLIKMLNGFTGFGVLSCRGKYIALCEGDDYWTDPLKLQKQVDFFNRKEDGFIMSYHDASLIDEKGSLISKSMFRDKEKRDLSSTEIISGEYMHTSTIMFKNGSISQLPSKSCYVLNGDDLLYTLLAQYGGAKYLTNIKPNNYRIHAGGIWSPLKRYDRLRHNINTRKHLIDLVEPKYKWIINRYLFVSNIQMVPFCHGLNQRLKQYIHAYKYFALDTRYIGKWFSVHVYLLNMIFEKMKQVQHNFF